MLNAGNSNVPKAPGGRRRASHQDYALKVIDEYKHFLYLMCWAGHPVTPSVEVDQAWHLHMLYTRSYWQDLAPRLPIAPPTTTGRPKVAARKTRNSPNGTKSYRRLFGMPAPRHIWPPASVRFADEQQLVFIDADKLYMTSKRRLHEIVIPCGLLVLLTIGWFLC